MTAPRVSILGPPGAGKTTQAEQVADAFDLELIDTGAILRENEAMETDYGTLDEYVDRGELVPDSVVNEVVGEILASADGVVFDGYPRTLAQAEFLDGVVDLDAVVWLDAPDDAARERLTDRWVCASCGEEFHASDLSEDIEDDLSEDFEDPDECPECGHDLSRPDEAAPEVVRTKFDAYYEETVEVVEFYRQRGLVVEVDADRPPEAVESDVRDAVEPVA